MTENPQLEEARKAFEIAKALAPSNASLTSYKPYLCTAIPYFRLLANSQDPEISLDAISKRLECEDAFRKLFGRSFLTEQDGLSYDEAVALGDGAKSS
jgi:PAS domain-containing protein